MPFDWPPNAYLKTKIRIAQILWTLWLDFEGEINDDTDAVKVLIDAMRGHGVDIPDSDVMSYRIILPHLDGGKYGHYLNRLVLGQKTKRIKLVSDLPDESHLPDGAGGYSQDERIDRQLFADLETVPARGATRDMAEQQPPAGPTADTPADLACEESRDASGNPPELARELPRDPGQELLAREPTRDLSSMQPASGPAGDDQNMPIESARGDARDLVAATDDDLELDSIGSTIQRLDAEAADLFTPVVIDDGAAGSHRELLDTIVSLVAELEGRLSVGVGRVEPEGRTEADWQRLAEERSTVASRLAAVLRRAKDAEARLIEKNKEIDGLHLQIRTLVGQMERLEANNKALMSGERAGGQHVRGAQRFLSEVPSDRPEGGRNRRRTTGSDSKLAYSVGPP